MMDEPARHRIVLVTGLSGAGKLSILRCLEDIGFEATDNPPMALVEQMVSDDPGGQMHKVAVGLDVRSRGFNAEGLVQALDRLRQNPRVQVDLAFAWADGETLRRRFTETRRRHPLAPHGQVSAGITAEEALIAPLRLAADVVVDTSDLALPELRQMIERRFGDGGPGGGLSVTLVSFAYPAGLPREADLVMDVRFLRNPHYQTVLRPRTGLDPEVATYVEADVDFYGFYSRFLGLIELLLPRYVQEGKKYVTIAIGCTGGRHRSVTVVERLAAALKGSGWRVTATHRELASEGAAPAAMPGQPQSMDASA